MPNPVIVPCPVNAWTKVATNVLSGAVKTLSTAPAKYYETYRLTGEAAPAGITEAFPFKGVLGISSDVAIDVYVYPKGAAGSVRVDA